jgi:KH/beta-lactamase-domain protein
LNEFLKDISKQINELLPADCEVTKIELEGPKIIIYTKNISKFLGNESLVKTLAGKLKKRFVVRSDTTKLMEVEKALEKIKEIVPEEAGVSNIAFDESFNEVAIDAKKLGLVIGKDGKTLKEIAMQTGWAPRLLRTPTSSSPTIKGIRETLIKDNKDVKKFLVKTGKDIYRKQTKPTEWIRITALGGCKEVGRSCLLIETPESKVLLDCGVNVASTEKAFPYLDSVNFSLDEIDAVVISHGHLDHAGFLPYLYSYGYKGPVYCTAATRDVMTLLQVDYMNVLARTAKTPPYGEKDIKEEVKHCITREYGEVTDIAPDVRLTLYNAGHLLGSSLVHLHIGEGAHNLVYTGDLKFGFTELFDCAEVRFPRLETLFIESTYGNQGDVQPPRHVCENKLIDIIKETVDKNGIVLIPSFSVGRAQEIMLIIEKHARQNNWNIPVYLDGMIKEANAIHTAYPEYLRKNLQRRVLHNDSPFDSNIFQEVDPKERDSILENGRCIILATSGMMVGGPVIEYFKKTCEDPKNALVFVGYQSEGSLGRKLQRGSKDVALEDNGKTQGFKVNMRVETIEGLSGHSGINQLLGYFKKLYPKPERVLTVHGEEKKCMNLARTLAYKFKVEATSPQNLDSIRLK